MIVRYEGTRMALNVKPGVVLESQRCQILCAQRRGLQYGLDDGIQHKAAQLLHTGIGPAEQIEAALEQFRLWDMTRRGIAVLRVLARQEERLELLIQALT